jgi:hypothetical protein
VTTSSPSAITRETGAPHTQPRDPTTEPQPTPSTRRRRPRVLLATAATGSPRARAPGRTLASVGPLLSHYGITRVADPVASEGTRNRLSIQAATKNVAEL